MPHGSTARSSTMFDFHGMPIAYEQAGAGEPVLFLHNIGGDRTIWAAQYEALRATNRVYALDLFGYGRSAIPDDGYTVEHYLQLVSEFIEGHRLRGVTLVGHCFGSALSLLYARRHPQNVRALVLSSPLTAATLRPTPTGWLASAAKHVPFGSLFGGTRVPAPVATWIVREQLGPRGRSMAAETFTPLQQRWGEPRRLLPAAAIARDLPRLAELDTFRPPAAFPPITTLWGMKNRILSPAAGERLNATLQPIEAVTLPDCGHLLMLEAPDTVTATLRTTLQRVQWRSRVAEAQGAPLKPGANGR